MWKREHREPGEPAESSGGTPSSLDWRWLLGGRSTPLSPPTFPEDLRARAGPVRLVLSLAYQLSRLEYSLNPGGQLRAWVLFNLRVLLVALVPALSVLPLATLLLAQVVEGITQFLTAVVTWSELLVRLLVGILEALLLLFAIYVATALIALFSRWWNQRRRW